MARKIHHSVRWEGWIVNAIEAWAKENGSKNFTDSVNYLLAIELGRWGYTRMHYEPGIGQTPPDDVELTLNNNLSNPMNPPPEIEKRHQREINKLKRLILDYEDILTPEQKQQLTEQPMSFGGIQKKPLQVSDFDESIAGRILREHDPANPIHKKNRA